MSLRQILIPALLLALAAPALGGQRPGQRPGGGGGGGPDVGDLAPDFDLVRLEALLGEPVPPLPGDAPAATPAPDPTATATPTATAGTGDGEDAGEEEPEEEEAAAAAEPTPPPAPPAGNVRLADYRGQKAVVLAFSSYT